jgi:hypothetical protein
MLDALFTKLTTLNLNNLVATNCSHSLSCFVYEIASGYILMHRAIRDIMRQF